MLTALAATAPSSVRLANSANTSGAMTFGLAAMPLAMSATATKQPSSGRPCTSRNGSRSANWSPRAALVKPGRSVAGACSTVANTATLTNAMPV
jgi:hypothetical protein